MMRMNVLFVCSKNRWRSPTAEAIFSGEPGIECDSAGLNHDSENPIGADVVAWADLIFVMERDHLKKLKTRFKEHLGGARVICLDIPDNYPLMDPALVKLLKAKVTGFLPTA